MSMLRDVLFSTIASAATLVLTANADAVSGRPINVGTPLSIGGQPAVAVDSSGTAYIAWNDTENLAGAPNLIQYCVIPAGGTACMRKGTLRPANAMSETAIDNVQVLVDGAVLVILADVYGTVGGSQGHDEPEQEYQSTDGGATFIQVNGGISVADGVINADTGPLSAVILPGTGALGYGWNTAGDSPPTFAEFPLDSPPECSGATSPRCPYASLAPSTQPDQIGNAGGQFVSQQGANPGVLAIFNTNFTAGNLGCPGSFGTAFAYGSGSQGPTNDYSTSPGSPNSAWKVAITQADCDVQYPAAGGGASGFGVIETDLSTNHVVYHAFDQAHMDFDTPEVTVADWSELYPAISQDGAGGIYATYLGGGGGGPIALSYSADGGARWTTSALDPNTDLGASNVDSAVGPTGQGWAAWSDNGSVLAQQFDMTDAIPLSIGDTGTRTRKDVTVTVTCSWTPCTVTITVTATPKKKPAVTLATGTFTIDQSGPSALAVPLTKKGRQLLAIHHRHLDASILVVDMTPAGPESTTGMLKITTAKARK
jgi:hypothetical protein